MDNVIEFPKTKHGDGDTLAGKAKCMACRMEWVAVAPTGTVALECPACKTLNGHWVGSIYRNGDHWHCLCGNDLFYIQPHLIYCASCGTTQGFPNDR